MTPERKAAIEWALQRRQNRSLEDAIEEVREYLACILGSDTEVYRRLPDPEAVERSIAYAQHGDTYAWMALQGVCSGIDGDERGEYLECRLSSDTGNEELAALAVRSDMMAGQDYTYPTVDGRYRRLPDPEKVGRYINDARQGDAPAWLALHGICSDIANDGDTLPPSLAEFYADVEKGELPKPTKKGRKEQVKENIAIANAVRMLEGAEGIKGDRNDETRKKEPPVAAITIVAEILRKDRRAVKAAYYRRRDHPATDQQCRERLSK